MKPTDKPKFLEILAGVYDFYGRSLSPFATKVWWEMAQPFALEQVSKALSAHLTDADHGQFLPKPADLVRQLQGTNTDRSLMAWSKTFDAMQRVGAYASVAFDDPIVHAVVEDLGGWVKLCREETEVLPHVQRRFCEAYRAYVARGLPAHPAYLAGAHELSNQAGGPKKLLGHRPPMPTLIGDPKRAQAVMAGGTSEPKTQITHASEALRLAHAASEQLA